MQVVSVSGWSLDRLVQLDLAYPGLLSHFCLASNERRHIIAAFFAVDHRHADFRTPDRAGCSCGMRAMMQSSERHLVRCPSACAVP